MLEDLDLVIFPILGSAISYLSLEVVWHFTACKISGTAIIKPRLSKAVKNIVLEHSRA
jgi:hypothetical protein